MLDNRCCTKRNCTLMTCTECGFRGWIDNSYLWMGSTITCPRCGCTCEQEEENNAHN